LIAVSCLDALIDRGWHHEVCPAKYDSGRKGQQKSDSLHSGHVRPTGKNSAPSSGARN